MLIKQVRIIDPAAGVDRVGSILIENGRIQSLDGPEDYAGQVVGGDGLVALPGLVDMHVHLRDPGFCYKEDILTGGRAAAAGGFTTVACMPNTDPVLDSPEWIRYVLEKGARSGANVLPIAALTVGQRGEERTDFAALKGAGAVALSDDGVPVDSANLLRLAMLEARALGLVVISHCEDREMVQNYGVNEGAVSRRLGLPGRPAVAEDIMVARDLLLAGDTGAHVHIAHVSTRGAVELIRRAKRDGVRVTAETCPQYFTLTEEALLDRGALARVNPPLRAEADRAAVLEGLLDGTLDAIVTDHAPHSREEKSGPIADAPSGMIGLETSLGLALTALYHTGKLGLLDIARLMSLNPARILGLDRGTLATGAVADITLIDPEESWTVDPDAFLSRARNTPFGGMALRGRVRCTIRGGKIQYGG